MAKDGTYIERYRYDGSGNILEKTVRGKKILFAFDDSNQIVTKTDETGTTGFSYDAAGRLVEEGIKRYIYGNDGRVAKVMESGVEIASFDYYLDGQLASATENGRIERFLWDGLALVARGERTFLNEPAPTGGNPIASCGRVFLNDMLGSTVGIYDGKGENDIPVSMTLFGETSTEAVFFSGKTLVNNIGYSFRHRSYRPDFSKWFCRDPTGYPDGWNQFAYCNNWTTMCLDAYGTDIYHAIDREGADGLGHSMVIIGNDAEGYTAYDYQSNGWSGSGVSGSSSTDPASRQDVFATFQEAIDWLNSTREGDGKIDGIQKVETTSAEDAAARKAADAYMKENYGLFAHNCYDLLIAAVNAVNALRDGENKIDISHSLLPESAFDDNFGVGWKLAE